MDNDFKKDQLEEFLRQQLQDYKVAENAWNVPPDAWRDQILSKVEAKPVTKFNFKLFSFLLAVLLLSVIIYQFSEFDTKIEELSTELAIARTSLETAEDKIQELETQQENHSTITDEGQLDQTSVVTKTSKALSQTYDSRNIKPLSLPYEQASTTGDTDATLFKEINENASPLLELERAVLNLENARATALPIETDESKKNQEDLTVGFLQRLAFQVRSSAKPTEDVELQATSSSLLQNRISLKLLTSPLLLPKRTVTNRPEKFERSVEHRFEEKYLGIQLGWQLSRKWRIETGLTYTSYIAESLHDQHLHLSTKQENMPSLGPYDGHGDEELDTPFGEINTAYVFTLDPSIYKPSNSRIDLDLAIKSKTTLHYLNIPIILNYQLTHGRIGLSLRGGFLSSMRIGQRLELKEIVPENDLYQLKSSEVTSDIGGLQKFTLSYLIGAGVAYHVNPKFAFYLEPTYRGHVSPIANFEDNVQIRMETFGVYTGFRFHF